jgi:hypothetical protein
MTRPIQLRYTMDVRTVLVRYRHCAMSDYELSGYRFEGVLVVLSKMLRVFSDRNARSRAIPQRCMRSCEMFCDRVEYVARHLPICHHTLRRYGPDNHSIHNLYILYSLPTSTYSYPPLYTFIHGINDSTSHDHEHSCMSTHDVRHPYPP